MDYQGQQKLSPQQIKSILGLRTGRPVKIDFKTYSKTFCPHCGNYVSEYSNYCITCGQKLNWRQYYKLFNDLEFIEAKIDELKAYIDKNKSFSKKNSNYEDAFKTIKKLQKRKEELLKRFE